MKKVFFICLFIIAGLSANAQATAAKNTAAPKPDATMKAQRMTGVMEQRLLLSPDQKPKVLAINTTRAQAIDKLAASGNKATFEADKKAVIEKWKTDISAILTKDQQIKFETFVSEHNKKPAKK